MSIGRFAVIFLAACSGSTSDTPDAPVNVPQTILISGTAEEQDSGGGGPLEGVLVEAFTNADESTVITSATTDAQGNYTLTVTTNGAPLDGFLKATKSGLITTFLYPPEPLAADFDRASINMLSPDTFDLVQGGLLCDANQDPAKGTIAMLVYDANDAPVAGATISSSPAASSVCYNGNSGLPSDSATATADDGIGLMFNVTGDVTVSATAPGQTFRSHSVKARAATFTTTLVRP
ncbi:MAG: hypothetical protein H0V17_10085 [Deltaproteobacteria bacterium]|nr:hypothetical protein [Deltaproteobacteria bacterium]